MNVAAGVGLLDSIIMRTDDHPRDQAGRVFFHGADHGNAPQIFGRVLFGQPRKFRADLWHVLCDKAGFAFRQAIAHIVLFHQAQEERIDGRVVTRFVLEGMVMPDLI